MAGIKNIKTNPKHIKWEWANNLANWFKDRNFTPEEQAARTLGKTGYTDDGQLFVYGPNDTKIDPVASIENISKAKPEGWEDVVKNYNDTLTNAQNVQNITDEGVTAPQLGKLALGAASKYPLQTGAGVLTTGMNLAGLMDNDKLGGQIGGAALGGGLSWLAGLNPGYAYLATTAGGALGSLFDKLRAKREAEAQQAQMYQQVYR